MRTSCLVVMRLYTPTHPLTHAHTHTPTHLSHTHTDAPMLNCTPASLNNSSTNMTGVGTCNSSLPPRAATFPNDACSSADPCAGGVRLGTHLHGANTTPRLRKVTQWIMKSCRNWSSGVNRKDLKHNHLNFVGTMAIWQYGHPPWRHSLGTILAHIPFRGTMPKLLYSEKMHMHRLKRLGNKQSSNENEQHIHFAVSAFQDFDPFENNQETILSRNIWSQAPNLVFKFPTIQTFGCFGSGW